MTLHVPTEERDPQTAAAGREQQAARVGAINNAMAGLASVATLALLGALLWPNPQQGGLAIAVCLAGLVVVLAWMLFRLASAWSRRP
ncbi:MAG: hypothetical protein HY691_04920 [Chloroflexi bacterium]|nr:hypothetical protein [Chloroflexota bacterium]